MINNFTSAKKQFLREQNVNGDEFRTLLGLGIKIKNEKEEPASPPSKCQRQQEAQNE